MCTVSFQHAQSAKFLFASGNFTSAIGLVRLQYEATVRAIWLLYAASDKSVSLLMSELSEYSMKAANRLPMLSAMLKECEGKAPKNAMDPLLEF